MSAMLHGGQPREKADVGSATEDVPKATRKQSRDALKDAKSTKKEGKEGKMKSEKSMKNVAGALARFWVG